MSATDPPLIRARQLGARSDRLGGTGFARRLRAVRHGTDPTGVPRSYKRRRDASLMERVARQLNAR